MRYYSLLRNNKEFINSSGEEKIKFLLHSNIFEKTSFARIPLYKSFVTVHDITKALELKRTIKIQPKIELKEELYWFLANYYRDEITNVFVKFCLDFDNKIFGLSEEKKKKVAIKSYKKEKKRVFIEGVKLIDQDERGIPVNINTFKFIYGRRNALMSILSKDSDLLYSFLLGNIEKVLGSDINILEVKELIVLEGVIKNLVFLNEVYLFEEDDYLSRKLSQANNQEDIKSIPDLNTKKTDEKLEKLNLDISHEEALEYLLRSHFNV